MAMGTPCSGPTSSPAAIARSASRACSMASSGYVKQKQLSVGLTSSIRSSAFVTSVTGESEPSRMSAAASVAER